MATLSHSTYTIGFGHLASAAESFSSKIAPWYGRFTRHGSRTYGLWEYGAQKFGKQILLLVCHLTQVSSSPSFDRAVTALTAVLTLIILIGLANLTLTALMIYKEFLKAQSGVPGARIEKTMS